MEDFAHFTAKSKSQCLQNQPRVDPSYKSAVCGNGEVEEGEECDCGTPEVGTNLENYIPELYQKLLTNYYSIMLPFSLIYQTCFSTKTLRMHIGIILNDECSYISVYEFNNLYVIHTGAFQGLTAVAVLI